MQTQTNMNYPPDIILWQFQRHSIDLVVVHCLVTKNLFSPAPSPEPIQNDCHSSVETDDEREHMSDRMKISLKLLQHVGRSSVEMRTLSKLPENVGHSPVRMDDRRKTSGILDSSSSFARSWEERRNDISILHKEGQTCWPPALRTEQPIFTI